MVLERFHGDSFKKPKDVVLREASPGPAQAASKAKAKAKAQHGVSGDALPLWVAFDGKFAPLNFWNNWRPQGFDYSTPWTVGALASTGFDAPCSP